MATRSEILEKAATLLAASPSGDVSTRAICDAAGITQPVLYRRFGDKEGLLSAVADHVWEQYLTRKRAAEPSPDPLEDLRSGWDAHTAFALAQPHAYRLVFGSALGVRPAAAAEAMRLLAQVTERLAVAGLLSVSPDEAARVIMAANSGVALGMLLRPEEFPDGSSERVREATLRGILAGAGTDDPAGAAATTLLARLRADSDGFTAAEAALLGEWLSRLVAGAGTDHPFAIRHEPGGERGALGPRPHRERRT